MKRFIFWLGVAILFACIAMSCCTMTKIDKISDVSQQMKNDYPFSFTSLDNGWRVEMSVANGLMYFLYHDGEQAVMTTDNWTYLMYRVYFKNLKIPVSVRSFKYKDDIVYVITYTRKIFIPVLPREQVDRI